MSIGRLFFGFSGRIGLGAFWASLIVAGFVLGIFFIVYLPKDVVGLNDYVRQLYSGERVPCAYDIIAAIFLFWTTTAITVKRLHDLGKPGSWAVFWCLPILLSTVAIDLAQAGVDQQNPLYSLLSLPLSLVSIGASLYSFWINIQVMFFPGQDEANQYDLEAQSDTGSDFAPSDPITARLAMQRRLDVPTQAVSSARVPTVQRAARPSGFGRRGYPA